MLFNAIKVPYILEIHHIPGHPKAGNFKERVYKNLARLFMKWDSSKAAAVRVVNKKQVPDFLVRSGVPKEKLVYISSMYIDTEIFKPMNLEKKYDLIFAGRWTKNKGINLFLDAVNKMEAKAVIVGSGPEIKNIQSRIKQQKLENKVVLHGWAKDSKEVATLINQSKIFIMPSYNEGGPRVVPEAMACGTPVLATPVGIVPDVIKDRVSGRIIDWSGDDIARKAKELLGNGGEYIKYVENGFKIIKQFEKKSAIKNYADKLKELL